MQSRPDVAHTTARHSTARLSGTLVVALLALALPFIMAQTAAADVRPPGGRLDDPTVRKVDIAEPAIVRIALLFNVKITLTLCGQDYTLPQSYQTGGLGSGAFISANGDVLTADHMVAANGAEVVANPNADRDIANLLDNNPTCHLQTPIGASDIANGFLDAAGVPYTTQVLNVQHLIWQGTPYGGQLDTTSSQSILQALSHVPHLNGKVIAESSLTENDLAIMHVNLSDTPSIQLDDSSQVAADDQLTIIGYPGNGDEFRAVSDQTVDANDLLTPSVNNVSVSSIKSNSNGAKLIQVAGNVEHGDSGGPALDVNGNIVGVVSFGTSDGSAQTVGNTSFLRSSDDVQPLITQAGISTTPGNFEKQWEQAFSDYAATAPGHWHKAARELDALATTYPDFKGIQPYKDYADKAASIEQLPVDNSSIVLIISMLAVVALLAAIVLIVVMVRQRRRSRLAATLAPASQGLPFGAYGPPSQFGMYGPPSQYGGYAQPSQYGGYAQPSQYGGYAQPSQYGGYAQPSQYGAYGPSSQYARYPMQAPPSSVAATPVPVPTVPYADPAALPATDMPGVSHMHGDTGDAPFGRMMFPQVSNPTSWHGMASEGNGAYSGAQPNGAPNPAAPFPASGYGWPDPARERGVCLNGHSMPPGEIYCAMCGAPRTPTVSS